MSQDVPNLQRAIDLLACIANLECEANGEEVSQEDAQSNLNMAVNTARDALEIVQNVKDQMRNLAAEALGRGDYAQAWAHVADSLKGPAQKAERITDRPKCDGNHGGPRCADPECWNDSPDESFALSLTVPVYAADGEIVEPSQLTWKFTQGNLAAIRDSASLLFSSSPEFTSVTMRKPGGTFTWDSEAIKALDANLGLHVTKPEKDGSKMRFQFASHNDDEPLLGRRIDFTVLQEVFDLAQKHGISRAELNDMDEAFVLEAPGETYLLDEVDGELSTLETNQTDRPAC